MSLVLAETKDAIGVIVLNHPEKRNALSEALIGEITAALEDFQARNIRAVVLRAAAGVKVAGLPATMSANCLTVVATRWAGAIRCVF